MFIYGRTVTAYSMNIDKNYWPPECDPGRIRTKNAMGMMSTELSPAAKAFVYYAKQAEFPLLDVGSAYGVATIPALNNGAEVIACDLSEEHLSILRQSTRSELRHRLTTLVAKFPYELLFESESLSGILLSNVLHFLDGDEVTDGLNHCWWWLKPKGKLFINVITPYLYQHLIPEYESRVKEGIKWPGIFNTDLAVNEELLSRLPDFMHLFELDTLQNAIQEAHFTIDHINYFGYKNCPDGREFITLCATKLPQI